MTFKKAVFAYYGTFLFLIVFFPSVFYVSDPYSLFHRPWFAKDKMYANLRIQNYGLINFERFDGIIMGTSMLENTSAVEASEKLGGTYANLSVTGGSLYERFLILQFALKTKKIKSVISSIDYYFGEKKPIRNTFYPELYSDRPLAGKLKAYLTGKAALCVLLRKSCDLIKINLDRPNAWFTNWEHARRFGGFDNWLKYKNEDSQIRDAFADLLKKKKNYANEYQVYRDVVDNEIVPLFEHKDVSFSLIVPPYSVFWWTKRQDDLENLMKPYEYLVERTKDYPNVKIYWFYNDDFVYDISQYKDLAHHHQSVNSLQLDAIRDGTHILDANNYKQKITAFIERVRAFDTEPYLRQIRDAK